MNEQNEMAPPSLEAVSSADPRPAEETGQDVTPPPEEDNQPKKGKKRKKKVAVNAEKVRKAIAKLGGSASMDEILTELYGEVNRTLRSRVYHHVKKLREEGTVYTTGSTQNLVYHLKDGVKATASEPGLGDLFEAVGLIDDKRVVRSLDTHQLYRLERL